MRLCHCFVKRVCDCNLTTRVEAIVDCTIDDCTEIDEFLRSYGPSNFPTSTVEKLTCAENGHSSLPVIADRSEVSVLSSIVCEWFIHFIRDNEDVWIGIENDGNRLYFFSAKHFASGVVRRVDEKNFDLRPTERLDQFIFVKLPLVTIVGFLERKRNSHQFCTRHLYMVNVRWVHWAECDDFISFVAEGINETREGTVCSLRRYYFRHGVNFAAQFLPVNLSYFLHKLLLAR